MNEKEKRQLWWVIGRTMLTGLVEGWPLKNPYKLTDGEEDELIPYIHEHAAYLPIRAATATRATLLHVAHEFFGEAGRRELEHAPELSVH